MSGGTDWSDYQVPALASITSQDLGGTWQQVGAWISTADMIATTRQSLAGARADLASAWPPKSGEAAAIFYEVIDSIVGFMMDTEDAARTNAAALEQALNSMAATNDAVDQLHSTWQLYQRLMRNATVASQAQVDEGLPYDWTASLNAEARSHMVATDQVMFDIARSLIVPAELPPVLSTEPLTPIPSSSGGGSATASSSRRSVAQPRAGVTIAQVGHDSGSAQTGTPSDPVLTGQDSISTGGSPVDAGVSPGNGLPGTSGPLGPSTSGTNPGGLASGISTGASGVISPLSDLPILGDGSGPLGVSALRVPPAATPLRGVSDTVQSPIAGSPEAMAAATRGSSSAGPMTEPLEGASAPGGMLVPPMMGGLGQRSSSGRNRQTALDAAWDLPTGVPSILVPALEAEVHDPGVGVIGIDL